MKFFFGIVIIFILIFAGFIGYEVYKYLDQKNSLQFVPIVLDTASSTDVVANSTSTVSIVTKVDTSKWKMIDNTELGYSVKYPENLIVNKDELTLILAFPTKSYFHWPLEDEFRVTIIATSSCETKKLEKITINNKDIYLVSQSEDGALGTIFKEKTYMLNGNDSCYKIIVNSRGTNGADRVLDDPALIKKYNKQHEDEVKVVWDIINSIIYSFEIKEIPAGDIQS